MFVITLTLILIMGGEQKDMTQSRVMASLDECFSAARAWTDQDPRAAGAVGFAAGCEREPIPGRDG